MASDLAGTTTGDHESCPNPMCGCDPCRCPRPCLCGLAAVRRSEHEVWDPDRDEYRYIQIHTYTPAADDPAADDPVDHGAVDHGGHGPSGSDQAMSEPADAASGDVAEIVEGLGSTDQALTQVRRRAAAAGTAHSHHHHSTSTRTAEHNGHTIEIVTTYELRIDGELMTGHLGVNPDGSVHYHGLPNYSTSSAIDLARQIVDSFPDDYARPTRPPRVHAALDADRGVL